MALKNLLGNRKGTARAGSVTPAVTSGLRVSPCYEKAYKGILDNPCGQAVSAKIWPKKYTIDVDESDQHQRKTNKYRFDYNTRTEALVTEMFITLESQRTLAGKTYSTAEAAATGILFSMIGQTSGVFSTDKNATLPAHKHQLLPERIRWVDGRPEQPVPV